MRGRDRTAFRSGDKVADINREHIEQLVKRPGESLAVEIKTWISPADPAGQAKIIKGVIALRNRGGGYFVIGFDDKTMTADKDNAPADVRSTFHIDVIQALVTAHASEPFAITVEFVEHEGVHHPVIVVPAGVRTPVAAKSDLRVGDKFLIRSDEVYFRTLNSNNTVSSAKVKWKDWRDLVEICFDNREADIGRFFRRHLAGTDPASLQAFAMAIGSSAVAKESVDQKLEKLLAEGLGRYQIAVQGRDVPPHGSWEVALIVDGEFVQPELAPFGRLLGSSNPEYTGWPVWLNSRNFAYTESQPYTFERAWESMIILADGFSSHLDFMRQDPKGRFYSYRALEDDISTTRNAPVPLKVLDGILPVLRVGEAMAVGLAFAKALQADERTKLQFMFRWTGLKNRILTSWADRGRYITPRATRQDTVTSPTITVPIDTPPSALAGYVAMAVRPLHEAFDGFILSATVIEDLIDRLLNRRL